MWLKKDNIKVDSSLNKASRGDRQALEYLVQTYKNMAYTIAIRIVSNKEDAEEVVQDSFLKAFASLNKFRRASKFSTWLFRIVYNTSLSKLKDRKMTTINLDGDVDEYHLVVNELQGWDQLKSEERKKYVGLAIDKLSEDDRIIITLHYIAEKNISEICEILGKEKSAVKMRLLRGRKQLESSLQLLLKNEISELL